MASAGNMWQDVAPPVHRASPPPLWPEAPVHPLSPPVGRSVRDNLRQTSDTPGDTERRKRPAPGSRPALSGRQRRHGNSDHQPHQATTSHRPRDHRPARPARRGDGRQAAAARRGVAAGPRGCQAVPGPGPSGPRPVSPSSPASSSGRTRRYTDPPDDRTTVPPSG